MDHGMVIFNVCINFYNFMSLIIHGKIKVQKAMFSQVKGKVLNYSNINTDFILTV
jgi:hypothetical protein